MELQGTNGGQGVRPARLEKIIDGEIPVHRWRHA